MGAAADPSYGICFATVQRKQALGEAEVTPLAESAYAMLIVSAAPHQLLLKVPPGALLSKEAGMWEAPGQDTHLCVGPLPHLRRMLYPVPILAVILIVGAAHHPA